MALKPKDIDFPSRIEFTEAYIDRKLSERSFLMDAEYEEGNITVKVILPYVLCKSEIETITTMYKAAGWEVSTAPCQNVHRTIVMLTAPYKHWRK